MKTHLILSRSVDPRCQAALTKLVRTDAPPAPPREYPASPLVLWLAGLALAAVVGVTTWFSIGYLSRWMQ